MGNNIVITGAKQHNLKSINLEIPKNKLIVISGVSGSGKSSLAFDTIYAEGQRRYVENLSTYARQFLETHNKPQVEKITGLSPSIAIDQKSSFKNPRSTVGTITEIYDYLRILYAKIGQVYSPTTNLIIKKYTVNQIIKEVTDMKKGTKISILAPFIQSKNLFYYQKCGYKEIKLDNTYKNIECLSKEDINNKRKISLVISKLYIEENTKKEISENIHKTLQITKGILNIDIIKKVDTNDKIDKTLFFSEYFFCPKSNFVLKEVETKILSFNNPKGACKNCNGLSQELIFDVNLIIPNQSLSIREGAIVPFKAKSNKFSNSHAKFYENLLHELSRHFNFSLDVPYKTLDVKTQNMLLHGTNQVINFTRKDGYRTIKVQEKFEGIIKILETLNISSKNHYLANEINKFQTKVLCSKCKGTRLNREALSIKIDQLNIGELCSKKLSELYKWCKEISKKLSKHDLQISGLIIDEINTRLQYLINVGLEYLTLSRSSCTLSGGESQRIRLASQIGSNLTGVIYVLDEPSVGLHQRDNDKLIVSLKHLRDLGNTVIVVEHDEDTIMKSDYIIDIGKHAGEKGGNLIAHGKPNEILGNTNSLTSMYLSQKYYIPIPSTRRNINKNKLIIINGININNIKNLDVKFPVGNLTTITGVSGSGKSSLLNVLYKITMDKLGNTSRNNIFYKEIHGTQHIDKIIEINQRSIGRTPRSNPVTYIGVFTPIRYWFANLKEAQLRGFQAGRFSFNIKGGRCEKCEGDGMLKVEMHFLPDVYVKCQDCQGKRYNKATLDINYKGKNISDILNMSVSEAIVFFKKSEIIYEKLKALEDVGLGYISIGQSATTLSGGEAQRIKLAKELSKKSTGRTLYILDEPTTGLHSHDIKNLLKVLHRLVDLGNTVIIIEHNLHVIKTADHIIDMGPYGGDKGGNIIAEGTPEHIASVSNSITGQYLKNKLE